eukprot:scaffold1803_cov92-Amphora_coffeaeformis.AAC.27
MKILLVLLYPFAFSTAFHVVNSPAKVRRSALKVVDSIGLGEDRRTQEAEEYPSELPFVSSGAVSDCEEYAYLIRNLAANLQDTKQKLSEIKQTVQRLSALESSHPGVAKLGKIPAHLKLALIEARAINDVYGPHSKQADMAWQNVADAHDRQQKELTVAEVQLEMQFATELSEESYMKGHEHDADTVLDMDSLEDVMDGLARIEQLARLAEIETERVDKIMDLF